MPHQNQEPRTSTTQTPPSSPVAEAAATVPATCNKRDVRFATITLPPLPTIQGLRKDPQAIPAQVISSSAATPAAAEGSTRETTLTKEIVQPHSTTSKSTATSEAREPQGTLDTLRGKATLAALAVISLASTLYFSRIRSPRETSQNTGDAPVPTNVVKGPSLKTDSISSSSERVWSSHILAATRANETTTPPLTASGATVREIFKAKPRPDTSTTTERKLVGPTLEELGIAECTLDASSDTLSALVERYYKQSLAQSGEGATEKDIWTKVEQQAQQERMDIQEILKELSRRREVASTSGPESIGTLVNASTPQLEALVQQLHIESASQVGADAPQATLWDAAARIATERGVNLKGLLTEAALRQSRASIAPASQEPPHSPPASPSQEKQRETEATPSTSHFIQATKENMRQLIATQEDYLERAAQIPGIDKRNKPLLWQKACELASVEGLDLRANSRKMVVGAMQMRGSSGAIDILNAYGQMATIDRSDIQLHGHIRRGQRVEVLTSQGIPLAVNHTRGFLGFHLKERTIAGPRLKKPEAAAHFEKAHSDMQTASQPATTTEKPGFVVASRSSGAEQRTSKGG